MLHNLLLLLSKNQLQESPRKKKHKAEMSKSKSKLILNKPHINKQSIKLQQSTPDIQLESKAK